MSSLKLVVLAAVLVVPAGIYFHTKAEQPPRTSDRSAPAPTVMDPLPPLILPPELRQPPAGWESPFLKHPLDPAWKAVGKVSSVASLADQAAMLVEATKYEVLPESCVLRSRVLIWDVQEHAVARQAMNFLPEDQQASSSYQDPSIVLITSRTRDAAGKVVFFTKLEVSVVDWPTRKVVARTTLTVLRSMLDDDQAHRVNEDLNLTDWIRRQPR